jgi:nucleoid-associated protein YgaU
VKPPISQHVDAKKASVVPVTDAPVVLQPVSKPAPPSETTPAQPVVREVDLGIDPPLKTQVIQADKPLESVKVKQGETLYQISLQTLGKYDRNVLQKLRAVNPWLNDPNHIITGQKIQIPGQATLSSSEGQTAELAPNTSLAKAGKQ